MNSPIVIPTTTTPKAPWAGNTQCVGQDVGSSALSFEHSRVFTDLDAPYRVAVVQEFSIGADVTTIHPPIVQVSGFDDHDDESGNLDSRSAGTLAAALMGASALLSQIESEAGEQ